MADTEILKQGEWTSQQFRATGAMLVEVLAPPELSAEIAVDGLSGSLRSQSPQSGAFPLQAVSESASVLAVSQAKAPFPGGARVDLSIAFPSIGRSFLIQGLDIAGHERALLVRLTREGDTWQLRPQAEPPTSGLPEVSRPELRTANPLGADSGPGAKDPSVALGAWAARRAAEIGVPAHPRITELIIDSSVSMAQHRSRVDRLCRFVTALARATGATEPRVRERAVGGYAAAGVGSVLSGAPEADAGDHLIGGQRRKAVITDLPLLQEGVECLVIGDPAIVDVLSASEGGVHVPDEGTWQELDRDDVAYTDQTLQRLEALMTWLSLPAPETQERS